MQIGQSRPAVADVIDTHRAEIERRWLEQVKAHIGNRPIEITQLRNAMPDYLCRLAAVLRSDQPLAPEATAMWVDIARHHAVTRVQLGFDIEQLVHEFVVLRRVLFEVLRAAGALGDPASTDNIVEIIEAAIAKSVKSYVESRDAQLQRQQATHVGFLVHEFKNPISAAQLALEQLERTKREQTRPLLRERIKRSLSRLHELVAKVLLLERLEGTTVEYRPTEVRIAEMLDDVLAPVRELAAAKRVDLSVDVDSSITLRADRTLIASAAQNLVENAVKYTDAGHVEVRAEVGDEDVTLHVFDQCGGLEEDQISRLFEPFRRGHPNKPGTGLGLAIARHAVEAQGGQIGADSKRGAGCHFWIRLPKDGRRAAGQ